MAEKKAKQMEIDMDNQKDPVKEKALEDIVKSVEAYLGLNEKKTPLKGAA